MSEGQWDDEGLEEAVEDEKCKRIRKDGEADEESVVGSNIEPKVAAEGSSEECEDSSDSEVMVFLERNAEGSKMSLLSRDSEDSETSLSWGDSSDIDEHEGDKDNINMQSVSDDERDGGVLGWD